MTTYLEPGATIGIIGAGQLGKMMAQSAQKYGYQVTTYDPNPTSCAFAVSNWHQVGSFDDETALIEFAQKVDVITYEFENINANILAKLDREAHLPQGTFLLLKSQDRILEKNWLKEIGIPTAAFWPVNTWQELEEAIEASGFPAILKTTRFGYDGKGQIKLDSLKQLQENQVVIEAMLAGGCVLEEFCPFVAEVSVMVVRDQLGKVSTFPLSQNVHKEGILFTSTAPAAVDSEVEEAIKQYADQVAAKGQLVGVMGIEFFIMADGSVVVNELAPRPHNSGHYTIEACNVSQFDQHILAVVGRPLSQIHQFQPALMINLLGQDLSLVPSINQLYPDANVHLYQKGEAKTNRKMGHITCLGDTLSEYEPLLEMIQKERDKMD